MKTARRVRRRCSRRVVAGVVFLWPAPRRARADRVRARRLRPLPDAPRAGPASRGELRDADGTLTKYDDVGCLLRATLADDAPRDARGLGRGSRGRRLRAARSPRTSSAADGPSTPMGSRPRRVPRRRPRRDAFADRRNDGDVVRARGRCSASPRAGACRPERTPGSAMRTDDRRPACSRSSAPPRPGRRAPADRRRRRRPARRSIIAWCSGCHGERGRRGRPGRRVPRSAAARLHEDGCSSSAPRRRGSRRRPPTSSA